MLKVFQYPVRALQLWWWRRQIRAETKQILSKYDDMGLKSADLPTRKYRVGDFWNTRKGRLEDVQDLQALETLYRIASGDRYPLSHPMCKNEVAPIIKLHK